MHGFAEAAAGSSPVKRNSASIQQVAAIGQPGEIGCPQAIHRKKFVIRKHLADVAAHPRKR
jgi:hypothetical protein